MQEELNKIVQDLEVLKKQASVLFEKLKDTSIPLEERWNVFEVLSKNFPVEEGWVEHFSFKEKHDLSYYDDFDIERYETVSLVDLYYGLEKYEYPGAEKLYEKLGEEEYAKLLLETKEEFLQRGITHFVYDW